MILKFLLGVLVGYIVYKFLVELVFPVVQTTRQVRQQFRDIHQKMQEQANQGQQSSPPQPEQKQNGRQPVGDYIDFEEVK